MKPTRWNLRSVAIYGAIGGLLIGISEIRFSLVGRP